ncbi:hypothetical protein LI292_18165, partial [Blautia obeum]|uniref:rubredoxin-like domain-containing protein n=1 Tax=Blautia obeum TaxID=40520 RepID=UPI00302EE445|nr:hypothetical protein [Blautia obeum]
MKKWVCTVCGYVHEGDTAPEKCPTCGVPAEKFKEQTGDREVTICLQQCGHARCGSRLQDSFVRVFRRSEVIQVHACNRLKFGIGSSGTVRRHAQLSGSISLHIFVKIL